jgi:16S rRNA (guanine527-N7)-methyltransferase
VIDWTALLDREIDLARPGLAPESAAQLVNYLTLLSKWASAINLVASATTPDDLVAHHVPDCLALRDHLGDANRLVDVGSGGGLPGAVLAIACPHLSVTALEPVHKKHAFLAAVRRDLPLDNFTPLAERDDQHRARSDFRPYDIAVSRAVFAPASWLTRGAELVRPGGRVLAMEGRERIHLPPGAERHPYRLAQRDRAIIVWQR